MELEDGSFTNFPYSETFLISYIRFVSSFDKFDLCFYSYEKKWMNIKIVYVCISSPSIVLGRVDYKLYVVQIFQIQ